MKRGIERLPGEWSKRLRETKQNKSLGLPTERHGHAIEGKSGQYLGHDAETGMFDSEPRVEYVLGLTSFPSCDGRPSIDALRQVRHGTCTRASKGKPRPYLHLLWKDLPLELFPMLRRKVA